MKNESGFELNLSIWIIDKLILIHLNGIVRPVKIHTSMGQWMDKQSCSNIKSFLILNISADLQ